MGCARWISHMIHCIWTHDSITIPRMFKQYLLAILWHWFSNSLLAKKMPRIFWTVSFSIFCHGFPNSFFVFVFFLTENILFGIGSTKLENRRYLEGFCSDSAVEACIMTARFVRSFGYALQLNRSNILPWTPLISNFADPIQFPKYNCVMCTS